MTREGDPEPAGVQARAMTLLEEVTADGVGDPAHLEARTAEFVLLMTRLRSHGLDAPRRVLEIGCGNGYSLLLWALAANEVVGVDVPDAAAAARQLVADRPGAERISVVEGRGEDLAAAGGRFDLVVTQYVLEHVADIARTIHELHAHLAPGGHALHVVPNMLDRTDWSIEYRLRTSPLRRLRQSLRDHGLARTLRGPLAHVPPHSPEFGSYADERREYRLERWVARLLRGGFEIVDYFPTRDVNWAILTRPQPSSNRGSGSGTM